MKLVASVLFLSFILMLPVLASSDARYQGDKPDAATQRILESTISLNLREMSLEEALKTITNKTGLQISFNRNRIPAQKSVSIDARNLTVQEVLNRLVSATKTRLLITREGHLAIVSRKLSTRKGSVQGRVTDARTGAPLFGANIMVKGTYLGTVSDGNGRFRLEDVPAGKQMVLVEFVGYERQNHPVDLAQAGEEAAIVAAMDTRVIPLKELVVTPGLCPKAPLTMPGTTIYCPPGADISIWSWG